jgi:glycosyltransferase involved in cell wall biosynthesis
MVTVHNGIAIPAAPPGANGVRAELGIPTEARLVAEVGRLCAVKGQRELIEAVARLADRRPDLHALVVGDDLEAGGRYRDELVRAANSLGVSARVLFAGYRPDVPAILDVVDVVVLPSWIEGLPIVLLEAMAHGLPVVATPVGGTPELVVDGETGLLVPPHDPERLAEAIERLLAEPELGRRLGEAGRARVRERFAEEAMTGRVLRLYDEIAAGR